MGTIKPKRYSFGSPRVIKLRVSLVYNLQELFQSAGVCMGFTEVEAILCCISTNESLIFVIGASIERP
jgi:hypothetical protein